MSHRSGCTLYSLLLILCPLPVKGAESAQALEHFEKRVRPLLVEHCYKCHSSESRKVRGGLLLDSKQGVLRGGDTGPAIVRGKPEESLLIQVVRHLKPDLEMPPTGKLSEGEISALEQWIREGAADPRVAATASHAAPVERGKASSADYWAYRPLNRPVPPDVNEIGWAARDLDRFILAGIEGKGLRPAKEAEKGVLARRIYFDLTGLPPTPEQLKRFIEEDSADAYERLVDKLLASPHFGERWGRHWLDVARYGESLTLRGFVLTDAWRYRDYVIQSFNEDRPFNRFMMEQVAGDLLPASSLEEKRRGIIATAFLAIADTNLEEQDKRQLRMDVVDEQLDTLGKAFLGQSIGCARCHDHKFDPIPARDYYALAGIFRSTRTLVHANVSKWIEAPLPMDPERERLIQAHEAKVAALQAEIGAMKKSSVATGATPAGKKVVPTASLEGLVIDDSAATPVGSWKHSTAVTPFAGSGYLHDENEGKGEKTLSFVAEVPRNGEYEVRLSYTPGSSRAANVPVTVFSADGEKIVIVNQRQVPPIDGLFISLGRHRFEKMGQSFVIVSNLGTTGHVTADAVQFIGPLDGASAAPVAIAETGTDPKSNAAHLARLESDLKKLVATGPVRETIISIEEEELKEIGDTQIHVRGSVHTLGENAQRGFLSAVPVSQKWAIPSDQSGRLQLGEWLAHPENPLPARVMANRVWHWLFGAGLVRTTDNFGTTGELPSHPELLDYLATRFVDQGWSVKKLVRDIVLSKAYRMSSEENAEALAIDPENRLVWRMNRRRLEAESIRDAMLSISGRLDSAMYGPTYQPELKSAMGYAHAAERRSVYVPAFRSAELELFKVFDAPISGSVTGVRNASTVAPQALFMMNNPFVLEQAAESARRLLNEKHPDDAARIDHAYGRTLGRMPTTAERQELLRFIADAEAAEREEYWAALFHALFASIEFRYLQ